MLLFRRGKVRPMWESVLKTEQLEIQVHPEKKTIRFQAGSQTRQEEGVVLSQAELFELMHTFLTINRAFNKETMYFDEPHAAGEPA